MGEWKTERREANSSTPPFPHSPIPLLICRSHVVYTSTTHRRSVKLLVSVALLFAVGIASAFSSGPLPGLTGAPGEGNCTQCHDSFGERTNTGGGSLIITHPPRYEVGQRLIFTVSINQPGQRRWGFQITALTVNDNQPAGQFVITDSLHTQLIQGANGRFYVEHTSAGTFPEQLSGASWTFDWIAPEIDIGPIAFYATSNAANNDGTRLGDWIYKKVSIISPPSFPAVTLLSPNGNEVLGIGQVFTVRWDASANADRFDLLFFPRPGALPTTIVSGLPGDSRRYDWIVPDMVTDSARVAVVAFNDAGSGTGRSEGTFMIADQSASLVQVLQPNEPRVVRGGTRLLIMWTVSRRLSLTDQQIRLSLDGGRTYPLILAPSLSACARSFNWLVPTNLQTQSARVLVLVRAVNDYIAADANDADFVIASDDTAPISLD